MARYAKFFSVGGGVGPNGLQLPLGTVLDATLRQVQDVTGTGSPLYLSTDSVRIGTTAASAIYWDNVNNRLGIGTNAPATTLHIKGLASTAPFYVQNAANLGLFAIQDDTQIVSYASKFNIRSTGGDYGGWFQTNATQSLQITNNVYNNGTACALNLNGIGVLINSLPTNLVASARLHVIGQGSTSATTSLLVKNSNGTEKLRIYDGLNSDIVMSSNPKNNGSGIIIQAVSGTTISPALTFQPATGSGQGRVYSDANRLYLGMTNTSGVESNNVYLFTIDNRLSKFAVTPDGSTTDASFYGKAIWDGGAAMTLRASSATQTANIFNVDNFDSTSSFLSVTATGNVGVGTSSPTQKLLVVGNVQGTNLISTANVACGNVLYNNNFYCESSGNTNIGSGQTPATARLQVKGSGSTNATTSLLIQNSSGTELMRVYDDGTLSNYATFRLGTSSGGGPSVFENAGNTLNLSADNNHDVGYTQIKARRTGAGGGVRIENTNYPSNPDNSAQLDVFSTTKGFLPPRMTTIEKNAIVTPAIGLMVFDTTLNRPCFYNGAWITL